MLAVDKNMFKIKTKQIVYAIAYFGLPLDVYSLLTSVPYLCIGNMNDCIL
jgi:hypothetical protein